MKINNTFPFLCIIAILFAACQPAAKKIATNPNAEIKAFWPDSLTQELIETVIKDQGQTHCLFSDRAPVWFFMDDWRTKLSAEDGFMPTDTSYIRAQMKYNGIYFFTLDTTKSPELEFIRLDSLRAWGLGADSDKFWEIYGKKVHRTFYMVYCPIYNKSHNLAVITFVSYGGSKWVDALRLLYRRVNKKWQLLKSIPDPYKI
jgi:hypothetical protein